MSSASSSPTLSTPNILILDHVNLNHERGRHDLVRAFYFETLGLACDPRKSENIARGKGGVWANAGIHQIHLSEGATAQVFDGVITVAYDSLEAVRGRLAVPPSVLVGTRYAWTGIMGDEIQVSDPWGSRFVLVERDGARDARGVQPGEVSEACGIVDVTVFVPGVVELEAVARFYTRLLGFTVKGWKEGKVMLFAGSEEQTISFSHRLEDEDTGYVRHDDVTEEDGRSSNAGVHLSMYVADLPRAYRAVEEMGSVYINYRFRRQAKTLEESVEQCMFRVLDVVDPEKPERGVLFKLEHEVRSAVTVDGEKYRSCPLDKVPQLPWGSVRSLDEEINVEAY